MNQTILFFQPQFGNIDINGNGLLWWETHCSSLAGLGLLIFFPHWFHFVFCFFQSLSFIYNLSISFILGCTVWEIRNRFHSLEKCSQIKGVSQVYGFVNSLLCVLGSLNHFKMAVNKVYRSSYTFLKKTARLVKNYFTHGGVSIYIWFAVTSYVSNTFESVNRVSLLPCFTRL